MRRRGVAIITQCMLLLGLFVFPTIALNQETRTVVDQLGRTVTIPKKVDRAVILMMPKIRSWAY